MRVSLLVIGRPRDAGLAEAIRDDWQVAFEHDAHVGFGRVAHDGKAYRLAE